MVRLIVDRHSIRLVDVGDIAEVVPRASPRSGDVVLRVREDQCALGRLIRPESAPGDTLIARLRGRRGSAGRRVRAQLAEERRSWLAEALVDPG